LLDTGLRVSELASLTLDDVNMNTGSIVVRHGKGGKQRIVHIGSKAQKALWKYITIYRRSESKSLFINRANEPLDVVGVKILIKRLGGARQSQRIAPQAAPYLRHQLLTRWGRRIQPAVSIGT
jgi:site-specific recombinase XerD